MSEGIRLAIVGATGTLGAELLAALESERLPIAELSLHASENSLGADVEFAGDVIPVDPQLPKLPGWDAVVVCAPGAAALQVVRDALRAEVPCFDCSGALLASPEVPLLLAALGEHDQLAGAPLISTPIGPAIAWSLVLSALEAAAGVRRVVGTVLHSASAGGRRSIDDLSDQTLALLSHREMPESTAFPYPLAFDCHPHPPAEDAAVAGEGRALTEARLEASLRRLVGSELGVAVTSVQVPAFAGESSTMMVETERPIDVAEARKVLGEAPGVDVWTDEDPPGSRDPIGRDEVLVSRIRADDSLGEGPGGALQLWMAADPVRLAAVNVVRLLSRRFDR